VWAGGRGEWADGTGTGVRGGTTRGAHGGFDGADGRGLVGEGTGVGGRGLLVRVGTGVTLGGVGAGVTLGGVGAGVVLWDSATGMYGRWWELAIAVPPSHTPAAATTAAPARPRTRSVRRFLRSVMGFLSVRTPHEPLARARRLSRARTNFSAEELGEGPEGLAPVADRVLLLG
jgi:hypothetical protein